MYWQLIDSLVTLPLLYAIMGTMIEFRFGKRRRFFLIGLAISFTVFMDGWNYMQGTGIANLYSNTWITTLLPNFLFLLYLAKHRDGGFLFAYLTVSVIASIATFLSYIFAYLLPWQSDAIPFLLHTAMLAGIFLLSHRLFRGRLFEAARYQGKRWLLYCTLPLICIVAWVMYNGSSTHLIDIGNKIYLPYAGYIYPHDIPLFIALLVMVFYTVSLILIIITATYHADEDRREKTALNFQSMALKERLFSLEEKDESLRILRHDISHHLSTLSGLLENQELFRAREYISQLDRNLIQVKQESYCTNAVINAIISYYVETAKREEIRFSVLVLISNDLPVDDMDIGAVLSNTLENAHNACMKLPLDAERFIELKLIQHKSQYVLDVSNSYDGAVEFGDDGRPVSQREDHGIGSQSISAFVRKYHSSIDYSAKDGVFSIRIMFT
jgi:hypothetical protein